MSSASSLMRAAAVASRRRSWAEHVSLLERAAKEGSPDAMARLGAWLVEGYVVAGKTVVRRDRRRGLHMLALAASKGSRNAPTILGNYYFEGGTVQRNWTKAAQWYRRAIAAGSEVAAINLAALYEGQHRYSHARNVLMKPARRGAVDAALRIARLDLLAPNNSASARKRALAMLKKYALSRQEYLRIQARMFLDELGMDVPRSRRKPEAVRRSVERAKRSREASSRVGRGAIRTGRLPR